VGASHGRPPRNKARTPTTSWSALPRLGVFSPAVWLFDCGQRKEHPPALAAIPDFVIGEGVPWSSRIRHGRRSAPQKLTFRLDPGRRPEPTSIQRPAFFAGPSAGCRPSTNPIAVRVTDDDLDAQSAVRSFKVVVQAQPRIVINEIMYHPRVTNAEFIELHNGSTNTACPWRTGG